MSCGVARADLCIYQGDDYHAIVTIYNPDGTTADIAAYTARAQIRLTAADPTVAVEIVTAVSSPTITLNIPHAETALLAGKYVWDLELTSATGEIMTVLAGSVAVAPEVTR